MIFNEDVWQVLLMLKAEVEKSFSIFEKIRVLELNFV